MVREMLAALTARGLSPRTVTYVRAVLRRALNQAVSDGLLMANPAAGRGMVPKLTQREMRVLGVAEVNHLLSETREDPYHALWAVLLTTGMRPSEALALCWPDVNLDRAEVRVLRKLRRPMQGAAWVVEDCKTEKSRRVVPLVSVTVEALRKHRDRQAVERLVADAGYRGPCSGQLTEGWRRRAGSLEASWPEYPLSALTETIQYGYTASAAQRPNGPRFLRITDIQRGRVDWSRVPSCDIIAADEDRFRLRSGDILFARTGATTGKSFLVRECPRAVFASYLIRVRPNEMVLADFLYLFFKSRRYWEHISDNLAGNAQPNCNASKLAELLVPVPSMTEQTEIVRRSEELLAIADTIENRLAAANVRIERLSQGVLSKAFRGELVPTEAELASQEGREYESGAALLERIRKERGIGMKAPSGNGRSTRRGKKGGVRRGT